MRYDIVRGWFRTPNGTPCLSYYREGTNDWNTLRSCFDEDEYGLRGRKVKGPALDIGGYLGSIAIGILVDDPDATAICVEPVPENAELIARNARVNGVDSRLSLVRGAVGRAGETVTVRYAYEGAENELHHAFVGNSTIARPTQAHRSVDYPAMTIADLVPEGDIGLCKVDTEGAEYAFLDSPDVARVVMFVGEWHNVPFPDGSTGSRDKVLALLGPTHDVTFSGPEGGPGGFTAVRR